MTESLTIVVGVPEPLAIKLHDVLKTWAGDDLVRRFLWLDASHLPGMAWRRGDPIAAEVLSTRGSEPARLLDEVARSASRTVRLILVQLLPGPGAAGDSVPAAVATLEEVLTRSMAPSQRLARLNLLVPATATAGLSPALLLPLWDVNAVAAPEDRRSDRHADAQLRDPGNYAAHAALECASIAALWSQQDHGVFDDRRITQSSERCQVVVARSFGRVVRGSGLVDQVLQRMFAIRGGGSPILAQSAGGAPARDPDGLVARTVAEFTARADGGSLNHRPPKAGEHRPIRVTVGLLQAITMLFSFLFSRLRALPGETVDQLRGGMERRLERFVQHATFGDGSMVAARFGSRSGDNPNGEPANDAARSARRHAEEILAQLESPASPPASPRLWQEFRSVCFGLVDGGELPGCVESPLDGSTRQILVDGSPVVAPPEERRFRLADVLPSGETGRPGAQVPLRECDPYQAEEARQWLAALIAEAKQAGEAEASTVEALEQAAARFEDWVARRSSTLVWRTAEHLGQQLDRARRSLHDAVAVLRAGAARLDEAARHAARRRLMRWWLLLLLVTLVGLGGADWWNRNGADTEQVATAVTVLLLLWLGGSLWAFMRFQRRVFQLLYRYNQAIWTYRDALQRAEHHGHEVVRLASLYEQLRDWAEIVAWMIHRPEGPPARAGKRSDPFGDSVHPLALRLAIGQSTSASLTRVSATAARSLFARGWLGALYTRYAQQVMAELKVERGLDETAPGFDPDAEVADPKRDPLLQAIREGRPAEGWRAEARTGVTGQLAATDPRELFPQVSVAGEDSDELPADDFLADLLPSPDDDQWRQSLVTSLWSPAALVNRTHEVREAALWLPAGLAAPSTSALVRYPTGRGSSGSDSYTIQTIRVDLTADCPFDQLSIFGAVAPAPVQPAPTTSVEIG
jgi:hypothetical protein